ncbi:MAG: UDP-N-acetylmuramoyl-L-alanine--D-glutamate ligase [Puniceicoccales bacterium]|jgi:UDP-N-acetylmuramoylalanine--D-glutamate ligase|nr:UDP-N-acetylmuramoyl-L-alanine--D-glutamate ligase [Puniceicoccales bacterium]
MDMLDVINSPGTVGILGDGVTGKAVVRFCGKRRIPYKIFDESGPGKEQFSKEEAKKYRLIVRSPSFTLSHGWTKLAMAAGCCCVSELDLASCFWQGKIVAITGTNGKTTTTEFVAHALQTHGQRAVTCGNIGRPFIEIVDSDINEHDAWAVVEVSSFQMDGGTLFRPDYVLWTNFANDHLDVHAGIREYFNCKANLLRSAKMPNGPQKHCFVGQSVHDFCKNLQVTDVSGKYIICSQFDLLPPESALNIRTQQENFALVQKFWTCNDFPIGCLQEAALTFKIPPHRLQIVAKIKRRDSRTGKEKEVEFWNDSKATNFHALNAALASFNKKVILIAGGKSKDEPLEKFQEIVVGRVKSLLLMGETGKVLYQALDANLIKNLEVAYKFFPNDGNLEKLMVDIVKYAFTIAEEGDVVLLSPGFSSLDWFKDYAERGKFFENGVLCLNLQNK